MGLKEPSMIRTIKECDNKSQVHDPLTIGEDESAMRVFCKQCKRRYVIYKDKVTGAPEKKLYAKIFKRDILQGSDPLFYKIYPHYLHI